MAIGRGLSNPRSPCTDQALSDRRLLCRCRGGRSRGNHSSADSETPASFYEPSKYFPVRPGYLEGNGPRHADVWRTLGIESAARSPSRSSTAWVGGTQEPSGCTVGL